MEEPEKKVEAKGLNPKFGQASGSGEKYRPSSRQLVEGIREGDDLMLSRAITLIESKRRDHQQQAQEVLQQCLPMRADSFRLGITGSPGVGKSTFIESFGMHQIERGKRVAVLAIDPSSQLSRGSILGDKTRMHKLAAHPDAFIRPSPAGDSLGGVASRTREIVFLCEAAGYDFIIVETVGVGQSETAVHSMVDFFLLLLLPGGGDELQGIKRGIVEMADLIAVNKAEGDNLKPARRARAEYARALHLFPPKASGWTARAVTCSGLEGKGLSEITDIIEEYQQETKSNRYFEQNRRQQARYWLHEHIDRQLKQLFTAHPEVEKMLPVMEKAVIKGDLTSQ
ncbi:MAG: methylmalonyl Co-A mutase-associated GTPase MeaB, partial [Saprospiraceae bacterium]|nr:methylmalonyl Co-A mutase-associated GTPase MeaB [Saprospiraceae bacterium]